MDARIHTRFPCWIPESIARRGWLTGSTTRTTIRGTNSALRARQASVIMNQAWDTVPRNTSRGLEAVQKWRSLVGFLAG
jgi:hypothetical protein